MSKKKGKGYQRSYDYSDWETSYRPAASNVLYPTDTNKYRKRPSLRLDASAKEHYAYLLTALHHANKHHRSAEYLVDNKYRNPVESSTPLYKQSTADRIKTYATLFSQFSIAGSSTGFDGKTSRKFTDLLKVSSDMLGDHGVILEHKKVKASLMLSNCRHFPNYALTVSQMPKEDSVLIESSPNYIANKILYGRYRSSLIHPTLFDSAKPYIYPATNTTPTDRKKLLLKPTFGLKATPDGVVDAAGELMYPVSGNEFRTQLIDFAQKGALVKPHVKGMGASGTRIYLKDLFRIALNTTEELIISAEKYNAEGVVRIPLPVESLITTCGVVYNEQLVPKNQELPYKNLIRQAVSDYIIYLSKEFFRKSDYTFQLTKDETVQSKTKNLLQGITDLPSDNENSHLPETGHEIVNHNRHTFTCPDISKVYTHYRFLNHKVFNCYTAQPLPDLTTLEKIYYAHYMQNNHLYNRTTWITSNLMDPNQHKTKVTSSPTGVADIFLPFIHTYNIPNASGTNTDDIGWTCSYQQILYGNYFERSSRNERGPINPIQSSLAPSFTEYHRLYSLIKKTYFMTTECAPEHVQSITDALDMFYYLRTVFVGLMDYSTTAFRNKVQHKYHDSLAQATIPYDHKSGYRFHNIDIKDLLSTSSDIEIAWDVTKDILTALEIVAKTLNSLSDEALMLLHSLLVGYSPERLIDRPSSSYGFGFTSSKINSRLEEAKDFVQLIRKGHASLTTPVQKVFELPAAQAFSYLKITSNRTHSYADIISKIYMCDGVDSILSLFYLSVTKQDNVQQFTHYSQAIDFDVALESSDANSPIALDPIVVASPLNIKNIASFILNWVKSQSTFAEGFDSILSPHQKKHLISVTPKAHDKMSDFTLLSKYLEKMLNSDYDPLQDFPTLSECFIFFSAIVERIQHPYTIKTSAISAGVSYLFLESLYHAEEYLYSRMFSYYTAVQNTSLIQRETILQASLVHRNIAANYDTYIKDLLGSSHFSLLNGDTTHNKNTFVELANFINQTYEYDKIPDTPVDALFPNSSKDAVYKAMWNALTAAHYSTIHIFTEPFKLTFGPDYVKAMTDCLDRFYKEAGSWASLDTVNRMTSFYEDLLLINPIVDFARAFMNPNISPASKAIWLGGNKEYQLFNNSIRHTTVKSSKFGLLSQSLYPSWTRLTESHHNTTAFAACLLPLQFAVSVDFSNEFTNMITSTNTYQKLEEAPYSSLPDVPLEQLKLVTSIPFGSLHHHYSYNPTNNGRFIRPIYYMVKRILKGSATAQQGISNIPFGNSLSNIGLLHHRGSSHVLRTPRLDVSGHDARVNWQDLPTMYHLATYKRFVKSQIELLKMVGKLPTHQEIENFKDEIICSAFDFTTVGNTRDFAQDTILLQTHALNFITNDIVHSSNNSKILAEELSEILTVYYETACYIINALVLKNALHEQPVTDPKYAQRLELFEEYVLNLDILTLTKHNSPELAAFGAVYMYFSYILANKHCVNKIGSAKMDEINSINPEEENPGATPKSIKKAGKELAELINNLLPKMNEAGEDEEEAEAKGVYDDDYGPQSGKDDQQPFGRKAGDSPGDFISKFFINPNQGTSNAKPNWKALGEKLFHPVVGITPLPFQDPERVLDPECITAEPMPSIVTDYEHFTGIFPNSYELYLNLTGQNVSLPLVTPYTLKKLVVIALDISGSMEGMPLQFTTAFIAHSFKKLFNEAGKTELHIIPYDTRVYRENVWIIHNKKELLQFKNTQINTGGGTSLQNCVPDLIQYVQELLAKDVKIIAPEIVTITDGQDDLKIPLSAFTYYEDGHPKQIKTHAVCIDRGRGNLDLLKLTDQMDTQYLVIDPTTGQVMFDKTELTNE
jgi:uncharacterized protein YegL